MIKLIKNTFYHETITKIKLIIFILFAKQLSFGKKCEEFERLFSAWQGRKHAVFVNSGSSANLALIQSLLNIGKLKKGDRVGFSALGWSTTVMPIIELGLIPVPIDVSIDTLNVMSENIPLNIKALFLTNLLGFCGDINEIEKKCKRLGILLLEDNCEGLGSKYKNKRLGNYGYASTFSFYVGHHLSTIEGGMICTNNPKLAQELRIVRAHGWDRNLDARSQKKIRKLHKLDYFHSRYTFYSNGYNLRPTEIQGFLGCEQIQYLDEMVIKRYLNYLYITDKSDRNYGIISNFAIPILFNSKKERDEIVKKYVNIIEMRPIVGGNLTKQPFYPYKTNCKNAQSIHERGLYIGNNPDMTRKELDIIKELFI